MTDKDSIIKSIDLATAMERTERARKGLQAYVDNFVSSCEIPCSNGECPVGDHWQDCSEDCEWYDFERTGIWELPALAGYERLYKEGNARGCPASPFRWSEPIGEWIVPGAIVSYVTGDSLVDIMDEFEVLAGLCYSFRYVGGEMDDHGHSFDDVVVSMMRAPELFYIPAWAESEYSKQEISFLELVRERLCHGLGIIPKVSIIWSDEDDEELARENDRAIAEGKWKPFSNRVSARIRELRSETEAKIQEREEDADKGERKDGE